MPPPDGRHHADADGDPVGAEDGGREQPRDVGQGEVALGILEAAHEEHERWQEQEEDGEDEEGDDAEPIPGEAERMRFGRTSRPKPSPMQIRAT